MTITMDLWDRAMTVTTVFNLNDAIISTVRIMGEQRAAGLDFDFLYIKVPEINNNSKNVS